LDQGLDAVTELMARLMEPALQEILEKSLHKDAKSEFQVWAQGERNITPNYRVVGEEGPDHANTFTAQVPLEDEVWGEGQGRSKQAAAQAAAADAISRVEKQNGQ